MLLAYLPNPDHSGNMTHSKSGNGDQQGIDIENKQQRI
jgi:hypothetical protein